MVEKTKAEQLKEDKAMHDSNPLNKIADGRVKKHIKYYDIENNEKTLNATLQEPSALLSKQIEDMADKGSGLADWGNICELLMDKIIVSPNINYEQLNHDLPKKYQSKIFRFTNLSGQKSKVTCKFPDYRTVFNIILSAQKLTGDSNSVNTIKSINNLLEDSDGNKVDFDFYNRGHDGFGMIDALPEKVLEYLNRIADKDGYLGLMIDTFQYSQTAITINNK